MEVLLLNKSNKINIGAVSFSDLNTSKLKLDAKNMKRLSIVDLNSSPKYLIDNYIRRIGNNYQIDQNKYELIFNILVDKNSINTIYRRIK